MKRVFLVFLCIISLTGIQATALEQPTKMFYTGDYASVLSDTTENFIIENSAALSESTGAQIVVVTVQDLDGRDVMDYGLDILRTWEVGSEKNNGVVILVSINDRKIGINVGYGLEGALNDSKVGRMIDTCAVPSLKENDFDTGIYQLYNAVLSEVYNEYGMEIPENVKSLEDYDNASEEDEGLGIIVVLSIIVLAVLLSIIQRRDGGGKNNGNGSYRGGRGFYGGYHGGGPRGSSGGFGGFSGGGGSGGGGGASRGF